MHTKRGHDIFHGTPLEFSWMAWDKPHDTLSPGYDLLTHALLSSLMENNSSISYLFVLLSFLLLYFKS
jgi:hypothetical protein